MARVYSKTDKVNEMEYGLLNKKMLSWQYHIDKEEDLLFIKRLVIVLLDNYPLDDTTLKLSFINDIERRIVTFRSNYRDEERNKFKMFEHKKPGCKKGTKRSAETIKKMKKAAKKRWKNR